MSGLSDLGFLTEIFVVTFPFFLTSTMRSFVVLLGACSAVAHATECPAADETNMLQGRASVSRHRQQKLMKATDAKGSDAQGLVKSLQHVANNFASMSTDDVNAALQAAADALATLSPAIQAQVGILQDTINHAAGAVEACHGEAGVVKRAALWEAAEAQAALSATCEEELATAVADEAQICSAASVADVQSECACNESTARREDKEELCAAILTGYELAYCEHNLQCNTHHDCHDTETAVYMVISADVSNEMGPVELEYIAAQQTTCIMDIIQSAMLAGAQIDFGAIAACSAVDTSPLLLVYPDLPAAPEPCLAATTGSPPCAHDSRLTAYWESGNCGVHGNDWNWDWCGNQAGDCPDTVEVDSSLCASGSAVLETMSGTGAANSYTRDGCNYFYHAQYVCASVEDAHDSRLTAYWESGNCGVHGNDWNWDWCGNQAGDCPDTRQVDSSLCASGSAVLETMSGTGAANSYTRDGCNYFYHAQYVCSPEVALPEGIVGSFNSWSASAGVHVLSGDFNGDGKVDVALLGGPGWGSIPVAHSRGDGRWSVTNCPVPSMNSWIDAAGARPLVADFDGDGRDDIALTGGNGWGSIPVAFAEGEGCFRVSDAAVTNFPSWAATANVQAVVGDFDGDGKADLAAIGNAGWGSLPTAFSNGDGTFRVTNVALGGSFNQWSSGSGVYVLAGDFNGDGKDDVALIGGSGWGSMPVAVSAGDGSYNSIANCAVAHFNNWIDASGARPLVGDFNGDGRDDVALTGGHGWGTIPVAFSEGQECWRVTNTGVTNFASWAATANVQAVAADVDGDGLADIAAIGNSGWGTLPVAFGHGDGAFRVVNHGI